MSIWRRSAREKLTSPANRRRVLDTDQSISALIYASVSLWCWRRRQVSWVRTRRRHSDGPVGRSCLGAIGAACAGWCRQYDGVLVGRRILVGDVLVAEWGAVGFGGRLVDDSAVSVR